MFMNNGYNPMFQRKPQMQPPNYFPQKQFGQQPTKISPDIMPPSIMPEQQQQFGGMMGLQNSPIMQIMPFMQQPPQPQPDNFSVNPSPFGSFDSNPLGQEQLMQQLLQKRQQALGDYSSMIRMF